MDSKSVSSRLRDLVKFLSSVQGDLSNITAPPFFIAPSSVVEAGNCWAERPSAFAAPALEPCPEKRSLLVLRLVLLSMRSQFYIGGAPGVSIKKPLNAFLGEVFLASWTDSGATTRLVAEQVSHHPPITAMHISDEEHGVRADGYARVEMSFAGSIDVRQVGHAMLSIDRYNEDYVIPLPEMKVRGMLRGTLYPEVLGTYYISSSSGFVSEIKFSGEGIFRGKRNTFEARMYRKDDPQKTSIYTVSGIWSHEWTVTDARTGKVVEKVVVEDPENAIAPMTIAELKDQDPWESRRAWAGVLEALNRGDYRDTSTEKSKLEQAQRQMRAKEAKSGIVWEPLLFKSISGTDHEAFHRLTDGLCWDLYDEKTKGVWRVNDEKVNMQRPFREGSTPLGLAV